MTCIVAIVEGETVVMGSDSAAVQDDEISVRAGCSKSWKCTVDSDEIMIGFAGNFADGQFIRHGFSWPQRKRNQSIENWLISCVQPALQRQLCKRFELRKNVEIDWTLILAMKPGRIFSLTQCGDVEESLMSFAAIGSGKQTALGCLHSLSLQESNLCARDRAFLALKIAETFHVSVRGPFHVDTL